MYEERKMAKCIYANDEWINLKEIVNKLPKKFYKDFGDLYLPYRAAPLQRGLPDDVNSFLQRFDGYITTIVNTQQIYIDTVRNKNIHQLIYEMDEVEITEESKQKIFAWIFSGEI